MSSRYGMTHPKKAAMLAETGYFLKALDELEKFDSVRIPLSLGSIRMKVEQLKKADFEYSQKLQGIITRINSV